MMIWLFLFASFVVVTRSQFACNEICSPMNGGCECRGDEVICNRVRNFDVAMLKCFPKTILRLKFFRTDLRLLPSRTFSAFKKLRHIELDTVRLQQVETEAFADLDSLETLIVKKNNNMKLPVKMFSVMNRIVSIQITDNVISEFDLNVFSNLNSLKMLNLTRNRIERLTPIETGFTILSTLDLSHNFIRELREGSITRRRNQNFIEYLKLQSNLISSIDKKSFASFLHLKEIDLSGNRLEVIDPDIVIGLRSLRRINIAENPIDCSSRLMPLKKEMLSRPALQWWPSSCDNGQAHDLLYCGARCASPRHRNGFFVNTISIDQLTTTTTTTTPPPTTRARKPIAHGNESLAQGSLDIAKNTERLAKPVDDHVILVAAILGSASVFIICVSLAICICYRAQRRRARDNLSTSSNSSSNADSHNSRRQIWKSSIAESTGGGSDIYKTYNGSAIMVPMPAIGGTCNSFPRGSAMMLPNYTSMEYLDYMTNSVNPTAIMAADLSHHGSDSTQTTHFHEPGSSTSPSDGIRVTPPSHNTFRSESLV